MHTLYECEYCEEVFDTAKECLEHEEYCSENPKLEKALIGNYYCDFELTDVEKGRYSYVHILGYDEDWGGLHGVRVTVDKDDSVALTVCHENFTWEDLKKYPPVDKEVWDRFIIMAMDELNPMLDAE